MAFPDNDGNKQLLPVYDNPIIYDSFLVFIFVNYNNFVNNCLYH